jgi:DNA polymerase-1
MTSWSELPLTEQHAAYLREQAAITAETAAAAGIRSASTVDELPEWAKSWGDQAVPAIVFPWRSPSGEVVEQVRPDTPAGDQKYLWPKGAGAILNAARAVTDAHDTVLIVEGTKQTWTAAAYAPANVAVYGVGGCRNWSADGIPLADLTIVEDRKVVVALDADSATNLDVYNAGLKLAEVCDNEGAESVTFVRLGAMGSKGLDDVLAARPQESRAAHLARLITKAKAKPADNKPSAKRTAREVTVPEADAGRPRIYMDQDRLDVINNVTQALINRWNTTKMFDHGGVLSILSSERRLGQAEAPVLLVLDKRTMTDLVQETLQSVRSGQNGELIYCYPEGSTLDAIFSRYRMFAPIDRIARVPFLRKDGSICQTPGYDEASFTYLSLDPNMAVIRVPDDPTGDDVAWAVKLIREEWLYDFFNNMPDEASRTNTVGLALTPFIRGLVPVVPMAVIDGLQMGVGKNLLADVAIAIPATGDGVEPMNWDQQDDAENRKQITSAFKDGADVYVFDEAHKLHGASLARVITAATWKDRNLGHSQMLGFRNQVTWVSLGNNVEVAGDIVRRVYRIALRPDCPNPQDRPSSAFRIPNIRRWTVEHRVEIITAMLTLIRAWFSAGQPIAKETSFGSFEEWERIVGGVLAHAGFEDFLGNTATWRRESNYDQQHWIAHVHWLWSCFGDRVFSTSQVREGMQSDRTGRAEPPPGLTDLTVPPKDYNRALGKAYGRFNGVHFDGVKLIKSEQMIHGNVQGWRVYGPTEGESDGFSGSLPVVTDPNPSPGGTGGTGGEVSPIRAEEKVSTRADTRDTHTRASGIDGISSPPVPPVPPNRQKGSENRRSIPSNGQNASEIALSVPEQPWTDVEQPSLFAGPATPEQPAALPTVDLATWSTEGDLELREGTVVFDIESTGPRLWPAEKGFIRITGVQQGRTIRVYDDAVEVASLLREAKLIVGHNLMGFDLIAFAVHHEVDIHELAEQGRLIDTMLTEVVVNPPEARTKQGQIMRSLGLDALGAAKDLGTKTHDLAALAKEFGGYDRIPVDDERYVTYCAGDVNLTAKIGRSQGAQTAYAKREHRVAAIAAQIRINGFRVDRGLLATRVAEGEALRARRLQQLQDRYGLPMTLPNGKPAKAPHATKEGKAAIARAFEDLGVELGATKSGGPAFGKEAREELVERHADRPDVLELLDTVGSLLGIRTVYGTVERCLVGDRVHPDITMFQASGRWSITEPGLTVMGKRGGKHVEREIFLPEPGHVIISADLSQVDARAVAAWCQDPAYLELFQPGRDSHTEIALAVWGDAGRREEAKVLGHGWNYGMGIAKLAAKIGDEDTAREFDRAMKERYPGLVAWKQDVAARADAGEVLDNGFGRRLRTTPGFGWTQGPALMGQSAARDILMHGLLRLPRDLYPYLRAVVHDEVVMSIPAERADEIEAQVIEALSFPWAPRDDFQTVDIEAGLGKRGANWGDVYRK